MLSGCESTFPCPELGSAIQDTCGRQPLQSQSNTSSKEFLLKGTAASLLRTWPKSKQAPNCCRSWQAVHALKLSNLSVAALTFHDPEDPVISHTSLVELRRLALYLD
ncbi:hypothetical protein NXS19_006786 [Fusarium pseudograminearum]|nr:hypothetical protein NXS19_006786 [Fusarium pseudograminearum]